MRNLALLLRFDGTAYGGFQVQKNADTVAARVQDAIEAVTGARSGIKGCSRTDAGVHALRYTLNFHTESSLPCEKFVPALNFHLPPDIAVMACRAVPEDFHARYSALGKRYRYRFYWGPRDPFREGRALRVNHPVDLERMARLAAAMEGEYDASSFCAAGGSIPPERRVRHVTRCAVEPQESGGCFVVEANGFLYHMVRIMAGTLLKGCREGWEPEDIRRVIAACDRAAAGETAPAHGLYLDEVFYGE